MRLYVVLLVLQIGCSSTQPSGPVPGAGSPTGSVDLPGGAGGISFDDLRFSTRLRRVLAPGSRTGNVYLIDPDTSSVTTINGFQSGDSLDEGNGYLFVVDRAATKLHVVDLTSRSIVASTAISSSPDYVRFVAPTNEAWVTEPGQGRIEVFSLPSTGTPTPTHAGFVTVSGGPEGLAVDATRMRAYAHLFGGKMVAIDLAGRAVVETWPTGCNGSHGIPTVDEARGLVFAGCSNAARVAVLDAAHGGTMLGSYTLGTGETILAYSPSRHHFYLRGDPGVPVAILAIPGSGAPALLGTVNAATAGHGAAADDVGAFWVCDAANGRLLRFVDANPATTP